VPPEVAQPGGGQQPGRPAPGLPLVRYAVSAAAEGGCQGIWAVYSRPEVLAVLEGHATCIHNPDAASGQAVRVSATGDLTVHGVTKSVTIPIDARLTGSKIELVGSITFPFSQFGMTPPSIGGFVTVQNNATMEFQLLLAQGA